MNTNSVYLITILVTNWMATGDTKFEHGTNFKVGPMTTNGMKWHVGPAVPLPPALPTVSLGQHP